MEILDRRLRKRHNKGVVQLLIRWSNRSELDASWEDYELLQEPVPKLRPAISINAYSLACLNFRIA